MIKVTEYIYRGPRPTSAIEYDILKDQGFAAVLSLEWGFEDILTGTVGYQKASCDSRGMVSIDIRMSDVFPPTPEELDEALDVLRIHEQHRLKIFVHCAKGVDRTGALILVYRVLDQGWSWIKAYSEWVSLGRHWWYDWWKHSLQLYLQESRR